MQIEIVLNGKFFKKISTKYEGHSNLSSFDVSLTCTQRNHSFTILISQMYKQLTVFVSALILGATSYAQTLPEVTTHQLFPEDGPVAPGFMGFYGVHTDEGVDHLYYQFKHMGGVVKAPDGTLTKAKIPGAGTIYLADDGEVEKVDHVYYTVANFAEGSDYLAGPSDDAPVLAESMMQIHGDQMNTIQRVATKTAKFEPIQDYSTFPAAQTEGLVPAQTWRNASIFIGQTGKISYHATNSFTLKDNYSEWKYANASYEKERVILKPKAEDIYATSELGYVNGQTETAQQFDPVTGNLTVAGGMGNKKDKENKYAYRTDIRFTTIGFDGEVVNRVDVKSDLPIKFFDSFALNGEQRIHNKLWEADVFVFIAKANPYDGSAEASELWRRYYFVDAKTGELLGQQDMTFTYGHQKFLRFINNEEGAATQVFFHQYRGRRGLTFVTATQDGSLEVKEMLGDDFEQHFNLPDALVTPYVSSVRYQAGIAEGEDIFIYSLKLEGNDTPLGFFATLHDANEKLTRLEPLYTLGDKKTELKVLSSGPGPFVYYEYKTGVLYDVSVRSFGGAESSDQNLIPDGLKMAGMYSQYYFPAQNSLYLLTQKDDFKGLTLVHVKY